MEEVTSLFENTSVFGGELSLTFTLLFFSAVIIIYSIFVFYFYKYLAKKNIIELNLSRYNQAEHPLAMKLSAILFYTLEYLIFLPVLTFFWFSVLSILLLVLSEGIDISTILLISAALVASVRVTSYISQQLSTDLAKMVPFTLLAIALTKPGFFKVGSLLASIGEIPSLLSNIPYYLLFIVAIELIMRVADTISKAFNLETEEIEEP